MITEKNLENQIIQYLKKKNYHYLDSGSVLRERKGNFKEVILFDVLEAAIKKINPDISQVALNEMILKIRSTKNIDLITANKRAHEFFINGIKIFDQKTKRYKNLYFIDFKNIQNNNFIVTNQFLMTSSDSEKKKLDLVIYLNGLPIIVFELKSPISNDKSIIHKAYKQMRNYQHYLEDLFVFNIFNVLSNQNTNKYGTITSPHERYSSWRNLNKTKLSSSDPVQTFINLLFDQSTLLKLLKSYTFFTEGEENEKIIAGYHQFYGVEATKKAVIKGIDKPFKKVNKKGGIFWHTQGSGKTFSMVMLVKNVLNLRGKLTTLIVTDRNNLDEQIYQVFQKTAKYIGQKIFKITSITNLKQQLKNKQQNGVFFSTVQKFTDQIPILSARDDILVIADEAHRSHNSLLEGKLKIINENQIVSKKTYTKRLHYAFPNAVFVGFTATPIKTKKYSTADVFGNYVSKYLISDALKDNFIVDIKYECRQEKLYLAPDKIAQLDQIHQETIEKIQQKNLNPDITIKNFNKRIQQIAKIIGDDDRIEKIAKDFIAHYQKRKNILKSKALFVAFNRKIAIKYYYAICRLAPELKKNLQIIISKDLRTDKPEEIKLIPTKEECINLAREFKKPDSNFKIAIVAHMWLTGFDVPCLDVIYIDRYLEMHNLMQAICRVNRVYSDAKNLELTKMTGLVVDYIGIWKKIEKAWQFYSNDMPINISGSKNIQTNKKHLLKEVTKIYQTFFPNLKSIDILQAQDKKSGYAYNFIQTMQEIVIKNRQQQKFVKDTHFLNKEFNITLSILSDQEKIQVQFLILTRSLLSKREVEDFDLEYEVTKINKLIEEAILHNKTIIHPNFHIKKEISLSSLFHYINDKKNELNDHPHLAVQKNIQAIKTIIQEYAKTNPIRSEKLSTKLQRLLQKYDNNFITEKEFRANLKFLIKDIEKNVKADQNSDMDQAERSFLEIINDNQYSRNSYDRKMIKKITKEVYHKVREKVDKTWYYNEAKKRMVRAEIKKVLVKYNYPPVDTAALQNSLVQNLTNYMETLPDYFLLEKK